MQSASVYGRMSAARGLAVNLTTECCSKSTLSIATAATLINNRIFNRLFNNFKLLTQNLSYHHHHKPIAASTDSPNHLHQARPIYNLANSTNRKNTASFLFSKILPTQSLHLVTAYSGYSKEFVNNSKSSKGSKATAMQFLNRKRGTVGDDAWFVASKNSTDVLGVADGVGGWRDIGVDPSKFSSNLMRTCKRIVEQGINPEQGDQSATHKTPIEILTSSYQALLENKNQALVGSSTACIIVFNRDSNYLHTANLGDSGFIIVRSNKIVHRSREQQHYFNSPFQIAILPNMSEPTNLFNDSPEEAEVSSYQLREGDFIVIATDGLWDNLGDSTIINEISKLKSFLLEDLQKTAQVLAKKAVELAFDPDYVSPFALSARRNGINISGGKPDDVTVLLARVSR